MREALKETSFARLLSQIVEDAGTLFRQELQLAKAEVSSTVDEKLRALLYAAVAGVFGLVALLMLSLTLVVVLMNNGIAAHWACLIVAAAACMIALVAFVNARAMIARSSFGSRSVKQMKHNVAAAKEAFQ